MSKWMTSLVVKYLLSNLTEENLNKWADIARNVVVPWLRSFGDGVIAKLKVLAVDSGNALAVTAVEALDVFWDALLPDTTTTL